jgi:acyl-CoA synthetase (AMP-forming)/AMP-acid ligase II
MVAFRQHDTRVMTCQPFSVELLVMLVKQYQINVFQAAPYQLTLMLQHPLLNTSDFDQILLFFALGGVVSENLRKSFRRVFPKHSLIIGYGMSEACICISSTGPADHIEGLTVGRIFNNVDVKVIGKNGQCVDVGVSGEILAKPEFPFLVRKFNFST